MDKSKGTQTAVSRLLEQGLEYVGPPTFLVFFLCRTDRTSPEAPTVIRQHRMGGSVEDVTVFGNADGVNTGCFKIKDTSQTAAGYRDCFFFMGLKRSLGSDLSRCKIVSCETDTENGNRERDTQTERERE